MPDHLPGRKLNTLALYPSCLTTRISFRGPLQLNILVCGQTVALLVVGQPTIPEPSPLDLSPELLLILIGTHLKLRILLLIVVNFSLIVGELHFSSGSVGHLSIHTVIFKKVRSSEELERNYLQLSKPTYVGQRNSKLR